MKTYLKYPFSLLERKFNFILLTDHIFFVITDCSNISFVFMYLIIFVREANSHCMYLINIHPWNSYFPGSVLFRCKSLCTSEKKKLGSTASLFFQSCSGAALYSLPELFRFHRGWSSVKEQQRHEVVGFYLPLNHSETTAALSRGEEVKRG